MTPKLTATDRKLLARALAEISDRWRNVERNLDVKARAQPGSWDIDPKAAARKHRAVKNRIKALSAVARKMDIDI